MSVTLHPEGARIYLHGDTYAVREAIKAAGAHWDADARAWWIGAKKRAEIERVIGSAKPSAAQEDDRLRRDRDNIQGTARYQGHSYFVCWSGRTSRGTEAYRLLFRDGSKTFWADAADVQPNKAFRRPVTLAMLQSPEARPTTQHPANCDCRRCLLEQADAAEDQDDFGYAETLRARAHGR